MTPSVETKLVDLARIVAAKRFLVLMEGPISSGKTSSIEFLANRTGHRFVRISNNEHTDIHFAPTDVMEALNCLLDDNRELVIPETQEVVRPHPHFMLFAGQNPPGLYYALREIQRIVTVFRELQKRRQSSPVFESKHGFAIFRDLFRWASCDELRGASSHWVHASCGASETK